MNAERNGKAETALLEEAKTGEITATCLGEKAFSDGTAAEGSLVPNITVSMGESTLWDPNEGDITTLGRTNSLGAACACIIKSPGESIALKTTLSAESVDKNKLKSEVPTICPV